MESSTCRRSTVRNLPTKPSWLASWTRPRCLPRARRTKTRTARQAHFQPRQPPLRKRWFARSTAAAVATSPSSAPRASKLGKICAPTSTQCIAHVLSSSNSSRAPRPSFSRTTGSCSTNLQTRGTDRRMSSPRCTTTNQASDLLPSLPRWPRPLSRVRPPALPSPQAPIPLSPPAPLLLLIRPSHRRHPLLPQTRGRPARRPSARL